MWIEQFLLIVYILLTGWSISFIPFVRKARLPVNYVRSLYFFKILVGLICAFYFSNISTDNDYLTFNEEGKLQYELLVSDPVLFFTDFKADIQAYGLGRVFETSDSFWGYLRFHLLHKIIGVLNLMTQGNFYFNSVIFSSLMFLAHLAFFRIFSSIYPSRRFVAMLTCLFLPSTLLYTSCFHKDGMVFFALGFVSFSFYKLLCVSSGRRFLHLATMGAGFIILFLFRNYVLVALLPAMTLALVSKSFPHQKLAAVFITYAIFITVFFVSSFGPLDLPAAVVQRKADFASLRGGKTNIAMSELHPDVKSFIQNFPEALNHSLLRPYVWEFSQLSVVLTALELLVYYLLFALFIVFGLRNQGSLHPFNIFGLALFFNMMLIIGYTIPNIGAIVRYRSIFWIFLLTPVICNINFQRITRYFRPATT
ncbi:MAG: hypothetical protein V4725_15640 [Bacteroidota bacterium]